MKNSSRQKLIFIYNANAGIGNTLVDIAHKIVSPSTYECGLCAITHGTFNERSEWKNFREDSDLEMSFLHKDEFEKEYASKFATKFTYPIVLISVVSDLEVLIRTEEFDNLKNATALISLINERVID